MPVKKCVFVLLFSVFTSVTHAQLTLSWAKRAGSTGNDGSRSMTVDGAGNVYSTGLFTGTVDFDPGQGIFTLTSSSFDDIYISKFDASGNFVWAKQITGDFATAYDICTDPSGNVLLTGIFSDYNDFDPGSQTAGLTAVAFHDMFICKLDANGNFVWVKRINGSSGETTGYGIVCDAAGNVFTTGYMYHYQTDFDPGSGTYYLGSTGGRDAFVCKLDSNGNFSWANAIIGNYHDIGTGIAIDASGNVLLTGTFQNTVDFDPSSATYTLVSASVSVDDVFICKYSNSGGFLWARRLGNSNGEAAISLAVDAAGNVYSTGAFSGIVDFNPGSGTYTMTSGSSGQTYLLKLDPSGNFAWARGFGGSDWTMPHTIAVDGNYKLYVNGQINGTTDFDPGAGTYTLSANNGKSFVTKFDSAGAWLWASQVDASFFSSWARYGTSMLVDANLSLHLSGYFIGTPDFDFTSSTSILTSAGAEDIFVAKYCQAPDQLSGIWGGPFGCTGGAMNFSIAPSLGATSYSWSLPAGFTGSSVTNSFSAVAGSSGGLVSVMAMNACGSSPSQTLGVSIVSGLSVSATNATICSPGSATLTAVGANSYSWSTGGTGSLVVTSQSATAIYTITGTASGCPNAFNTVTVSLAPVNLTLSATTPTVCAGETVTLAASGASTYSWSHGATTPSVVVTGSASSSGSYAVSGTTGPCTDTETITITSYSRPVISGTNVSICQGTTYTLNPAGAVSYTYSGGSSVVSPTVHTTYSVTGSGPEGCITLLPALFQVQVLALPVITVNSGTLCAGQVFTMMPAGASSYTYSNGSPVVTPSASASYSVTGTDSLGCISSSAAVASITVFALPVISANSGSICQGVVFTITPSGAATYSYSAGSNTVSPNVTTAFAVTGADTLGCVSLPVSSTVTVHALPMVSVNSGTICAGDTFTITPSGASSYTFSGGSHTVNPSSNSSYSVTGSSPQGCVSLPAISQIHVNSLPGFILSSTSSLVCLGETATLTATGPLNYSWSPNGETGASIVITPTISTLYAATGSDANGCVNTFSFTQNVDLCLGLVSQKVQSVKCYPNPTSGELTIGADQPVNLTLMNSLGQVVLRAFLPADRTQISLHALAQGIYILTLENAHFSSSFKIIRE